MDLAEENGARVIYRAWDNDFSAQRNFALRHIHTEWVLYLDADERMTDELVVNVKKAMERKEVKKYSMLRKVYAFGFEYKYGIFKPDEVLRLFKTKEVRWENRVHERPVCNHPKERLQGFINHYSYKNWQHWLDKASHYTTIWAESAYKNGKKIMVSSAFTHATYGFIRAYFIQLGFLDGYAGVYSSLQHFIYTLMKYQKLYELQQKDK